MSRRTAGLLGAAAVIAAITVVARVLGFGRYLVFSGTVGATCTGTAYATANQLPNVLYEVVAGGALAAAVVPLLAGPLARGDRDEADRVASALLSWALVVLVPAAVLLALVAGPLTALLLPDDGCSGLAALSTRMLQVFAPQVVLYGVGVVLTGVLQAHRRFVAPAVAPLLSTLVVIGAYLAFGAMAQGAQDRVGELSRSAELVLSGGTTLGVVALSLPLLWPARRAGVRFSPTLRFPPGVAARARGLAGAGVATLLAQQASVVAVLAVAGREGGVGTFNVYQYLQAVYLLPYAVLAVPLATSVFPRLAAAADLGDRSTYDRVLAATTRGVLLVSVAGAAALVALAPAVQALFGAVDQAGPSGLQGLATALSAAAPGLVGMALIAHLGRALYADGQHRAAGVATAAGWLGVAVGSALAASALAGGGPDPAAALLGLGVGSSVGMTAAGVLLWLAVRRSAGPAALRGTARTTAGATVVGAGACVLGRLTVDALLPVAADAADAVGVVDALVAGLGGGLVVLVVLACGLALLDRETVLSVVRRGRGGQRGSGGQADEAEQEVRS